MGNLKIEELLFDLKKEKSAIWTEDDKIKIRISSTQQNIEQIKSTLTAEKQQIVEVLKANNICTPEDFIKTTIIRYSGKKAPLSYAQERMLLIEEFSAGEDSAYHMPALFKLKNEVDDKGIEYAISAIGKRHHILRTTMHYDYSAQEWHQDINHQDIQVEYFSCSDADFEADLERLISKRFNLNSDYPLRAVIIRTSSEKFLLLTLHHIAADGWSVEIFERELVFLYEKFLGMHTDELPELSVQYSDYAQWQRYYLQGKTLQDQLNYWKGFLQDFSALKLPFDYQRPSKVSYNGDFISFTFSQEVSDKIRKLAAELSTTSHCILLSGFSVLLGKYSSQNDIVLGTPVANRHIPEISGLIGFFVNTVINRIGLKRNETFIQLVNRVHLQQVELQQYQDVPFQKLIEEMGVSRDLSANPIFQVFFTTQKFGNFEETSSSPKYFESIDLDNVYTKEKFDLSVFMHDSQEQITGDVSFSVDLFEKETISRFVNHYRELLKELLETDEFYDTISLLNATEKKVILEDFNATKIDYPKEKTIVELFEDQVLKTPDNVAVVFEEIKLTYKELNEKANQLACYLRHHYSVKPDDFIGIKLNRNETMIIAILGILKSGAAYVPIDTDYPEEKLAYIEKDTDCKVVLDEDEFQFFNLQRLKYSEENLEIINGPSDLAYVIYTSGSTGFPKGVMVEHRNVVRLVKPCSFFPLDERSTLLSTGSISFDATIIEFFGTLLNGAKLVLTDQKSLLDLSKLENIVRKYEVNCLWMTASWFNSVVENKIGLFTYISQLIVGGDIVSPVHTHKVFKSNPNIKIVNGYGPTENTTFSTTFDIQDEAYITIPIGKPIPNSLAYILDESMCPVPVGVVGKLYVGGDGVARGYLNNIELTTEKFIENPFEEGTKMYDTGDLARWLPDGNIEFLGRKDFQVKIRGYRVELGEIETHISHFSSSIKQVVAEAKEVKGEKVLVVYYTSDSENGIDKSELREYLQGKLPEYMVPGFFVELASIPLTSNGKIDRKALPGVSGEDLIRREYIAPATETEKKLSEIWQEVLGIEQVGITDNFFELGGHSLMVVQMLNRMHQNLSVQVSFKDFFASPTIKGIMKNLIGKEYVPILKAQEQNSYPLTPSQHRLWVLSQLEGGSLAYNMPAVVCLKGALNIGYFEKSFRRLVTRHEILRTSFKPDIVTGEIRQYITPDENLDFRIEVLDFTGKTESEIEDYLQSSNSEAFNLEASPLIRAFLLKRGNEEHLFFLSMHHIIGDGWSTEILVSEVVDVYNRLLEEENGSIIENEGSPELAIQYKDYAVWLQEEIKGEKYQRAEEYWLEQFAGELPVLELPSYKSRPLIQTYNGNRVSHLFPKEFTEKLKQYSEQHGATLFMTLMAGVKSLLYRYTRQQDIIVGTPIAGREHPDLENQIGLYLNTLAIRTRLEEGHNTFESVLAKEKETLLSAYEHQLYPFDELVGKLSLKRDPSRSALFDVMVVLQNQGQLQLGNAQNNIKGLEIEGYEHHWKTSQFDMSYTFAEEGGQLELSIEYNTDIYDDFLIQRFFSHFENLLTKAIEDQEGITGIEDLDYLTSAERDLLLIEFNNTKVDYPDDKTIIQLFEEQVNKTPDHVAAVFEGAELTYHKLNEEANQLGDYLRQNYHVKADDLIAVKLERNEKMMVAILGVLKSGAAYVPIDPEYPQERIEYIEHDTKAKVTIDKAFLENYQKDIQEKENRYTKENLPVISRPDSLAYVIYTSGTTGQPKGVMIENHSLINRLVWMQKAYSLTPEDTLIQKTTYSFDVSVWELLWWGIYGGKLSILAPKHEKSPSDIINNIHQNKVTVIHFVPSMLMVFLNYLESNTEQINRIAGLRQVFVSGEALTIAQRDLFYKLLPEVSLMNLYGPTEASIDVTYFNCREEYPTQSIPIGKPIDNTRMYILNESMDISPVGVCGNLYISGVGLSRGYLNKHELTAEKFVENPFEEGTKMYDTGDLARWLPDGNIEYLGRKDFQVKIRGYRIELGEIETHISHFSSSIKQVVAEAKEIKGEKVLVVYYTSDSENGIDKSELREYLQGKLPEYMIPGFFVELASIPLTSNGKIDRKALPGVSGEDLIKREYVSPRNETEQKLVEIWQEVLGVEQVGITDNFFELGGHSLMVVQMLNRMHQNLSVQMSFRDFFASPTIKGISSGIVLKEYTRIPKAPEQENYRLTPTQHRLWVLSQLEGGSLAYNMPAVVCLKGVLNIGYFEKSFRHLITRHEILRTSFKPDIVTGEIRQYITPDENLEFSIEVLDFTGKTESEIEDYLESSNNEAFNLEESPLIRAFLLKRGNEEHLFFLSMHHIIGDGWSTEILVSEVVDVYNRLLKEESDSTIEANENNEGSSALAIQYKDYAVWLEEEIKGEKYQKAEEYWLEQFAGELPVLELPSYKTRPLIQTYNGNSVSHLFPKEFTDKLKQYSEKHGATLFMTLMAGIKSLLYRYTGQKDIIVGTPIAGREHPDLENQIGLYLNILAIRTRLEEDHNTFESVLAKEKETLLSAYEYQLYSFDELVGKLNMKRDPSRSVLFDVTVGFHNQSQLHLGNTSNDIEGLQVEAYDYHRKTSQLDMGYTFAEEGGQLGLSIEYNTDIYDDFLIQRIFSHFENLMTQAIEDLEGTTGIEDLDYLTSDEHQQLLFDFNDTKVDYPKDKTIVELFEEQVDKTLDHVAVVFEGSELTYRELNEEANQLGDYLRQNYHVKADDLIAVKLERSEKMIVAILGILKSGAAYVPIDPEYPQERIEYIEQDTSAKVTIDKSFLENYKKDIQAKENQYTKENLPVSSRPDSLAYVIYTSGTTGQPKGVMIENKSVLRLVKPCTYFPLNEKNTLMSTGAINFDATVIEYFGTLLNGAKLILINSHELLDVELMGKQLNKHAVDSLWMTASWFSQIIDHNINVFKDLKQIIVGGDKLPPKQIKAFIEAFPHVRILNGYGPTENTTFSTSYLINEVSDQSIPIGKPIENSAVYILDNNLHPVSTGVKGTLYVSGEGLSRGYLNKPELTSEKFITNPFEEGTKMYDTGDLARWLPDGNIEFLGRKDFQVKIRGYRIELGEIEANISRFSSSINQVVADAREVNGGKVLVAYYTKSEESDIDKAELREYLQNKLPEYMVPRFFIELDAIPLTPNGKTDRKALPGVVGEDLIRSGFVAPENEIEKKLAEILQKILEVETVGISDNFFDLGGHSLLLIDLQNEISKQWNVKISLSDIFEKSVIKDLGIHISQMLELKDKNNPELLQDRIEKTYEF